MASLKKGIRNWKNLMSTFHAEGRRTLIKSFWRSKRHRKLRFSQICISRPFQQYQRETPNTPNVTHRSPNQAPPRTHLVQSALSSAALDSTCPPTVGAGHLERVLHNVRSSTTSITSTSCEADSTTSGVVTRPSRSMRPSPPVFASLGVVLRPKLIAIWGQRLRCRIQFIRRFHLLDDHLRWARLRFRARLEFRPKLFVL